MQLYSAASDKKSGIFYSFLPGFSAHRLSSRRYERTGARRLSEQATRIYADAQTRHLLAQHNRCFAEGGPVGWSSETELPLSAVDPTGQS